MFVSQWMRASVDQFVRYHLWSPGGLAGSSLLSCGFYLWSGVSRSQEIDIFESGGSSSGSGISVHALVSFYAGVSSSGFLPLLFGVCFDHDSVVYVIDVLFFAYEQSYMRDTVSPAEGIDASRWRPFFIFAAKAADFSSSP